MKYLILLFLFLLTACTPRVDLAVDQNVGGGGPEDSEVEQNHNPVSLDALIAEDIVGSDFKIGSVLDENEAYTRYYITYKSGELLISGIMNVPKGAGPFPLLVLNHGHIDPAIYTNGRGLKREQDYLARRGYVVVHSDYRGHADSDDIPEDEDWFRLGYTRDVIAAVKALQAAKFDFVDTSRVGMLGHSMGGGITMNAMVVAPELIDAAVLYAPVSADYRRNFDKWLVRRSELVGTLIQQFGSPTTSPEFYNGISAKNYFDRISVPVQIDHGTADESVPIEWSDELAGWLKDAGIDYQYNKYPDEKHELINQWPAMMGNIVKFFDKNVKNK